MHGKIGIYIQIKLIPGIDEVDAPRHTALKQGLCLALAPWEVPEAPAPAYIRSAYLRHTGTHSVIKTGEAPSSYEISLSVKVIEIEVEPRSLFKPVCCCCIYNGIIHCQA